MGEMLPGETVTIGGQVYVAVPLKTILPTTGDPIGPNQPPTSPNFGLVLAQNAQNGRIEVPFQNPEHKSDTKRTLPNHICRV